MHLQFQKRPFAAAFGILGVAWLTLNYLLFTRKGIIAYHPDFEGVLQWAWNSRTQGFAAAIGNYMPLYPYVVYAFSQFFDSFDALLSHAHWLKDFVILFDVFTYAFIVSILRPNRRDFAVFSGLLLLNIAIIYNSVFWGQIDNIHTLFIFLAFYYLLKNRLTPVAVLVTLAFFTKIVSVIFLPVFGLYVINEMVARRVSWKELGKATGWAIVTAVIVLLPLILSHNLDSFLENQRQFMATYQVVSGNAYNIWYLLSNRSDLISLENSTPLPLLQRTTYKSFGLFLFIVFYGITVFPLLKKIFLNLKHRTKWQIEGEQVLLACVLTPLVFFFFMTKIRERYAHPYVVFITLWCFHHRRFIFWFLATSIYFLQLEAVLQYLRSVNQSLTKLHTETNLFAPPFIAGLFLCLVFYLIYELYSPLRLRADARDVAGHSPFLRD